MVQVLEVQLYLIKLIIIYIVTIGEIQTLGMVYPVTPDIYRPMLARLRAEGLKTIDTIKILKS